MPAYRLTEEAAQDLEDIAEYTILRFGSEQLDIYKNPLETILAMISRGTVQGMLFKSFSKSNEYPDVYLVRWR